MDLMVEASPRRIFANAHTYHINSISVNSDQVINLARNSSAWPRKFIGKYLNASCHRNLFGSVTDLDPYILCSGIRN